MVYDTVVVGAGITGLAAAHELHRSGADVLVLEREDRVGGCIRSERTDDGFVLEHGPHTVRSADPELFGQLASLGLEGERVEAGTAGRKRYVVRRGRPVPVPSSPGGLLTTPLLSLPAKLRLLAEPLVPRGSTADESVAHFFRRRLGREVAEGPVAAFVSGVYAGDAERLSMAALFPSLLEGEREKGSLLRWGLSRLRGRREGGEGGASESRGAPSRSARLVNFRDGLARWPEALAATLPPGRVRTGAAVEVVRPADPGWEIRAEGGWLRARSVVLALPSRAAARLLRGGVTDGGRDASSGLADREDVRDLDLLASIPYAPVAVVQLGFPSGAVGHPLDGFGVLSPASEDREVLGILWVSSLFPGRAPDGAVLTASFVGGARTPDRVSESDDALVGRALREHAALLDARGDPIFVRVVRWERAIPQWNVGELDARAACDRIEARRPGLVLAGAYRGGVSVPDCWSDGRRAANRIGARATASRSR